MQAMVCRDLLLCIAASTEPFHSLCSTRPSGDCISDHQVLNGDLSDRCSDASAACETGDQEAMRDVAAIDVKAHHFPGVVYSRDSRSGGLRIIDSGEGSIVIPKAVFYAAGVIVPADHLSCVVDARNHRSCAGSAARCERIIDGGVGAVIVEKAILGPCRVEVV